MPHLYEYKMVACNCGWETVVKLLNHVLHSIRNINPLWLVVSELGLIECDYILNRCCVPASWADDTWRWLIHYMTWGWGRPERNDSTSVGYPCVYSLYFCRTYNHLYTSVPHTGRCFIYQTLIIYQSFLLIHELEERRSAKYIKLAH